MNLIRLLVIIAVAVIAYRLLRSALQARRVEPPTEKPKVTADTMLRCHRCGLHIPESEALFRDGLPYCSREHRDAEE